MKIPKQITGYGYIYPIIQKKKLKDKEGKWNGVINLKQGKIRLEKNRHQRAREATLLHEIIHLVDTQERINLSESKIEKLAKGLYQVLKDSNLLK